MICHARLLCFVPLTILQTVCQRGVEGRRHFFQQTVDLRRDDLAAVQHQLNRLLMRPLRDIQDCESSGVGRRLADKDCAIVGLPPTAT